MTWLPATLKRCAGDGDEYNPKSPSLHIHTLHTDTFPLSLSHSSFPFLYITFPSSSLPSSLTTLFFLPSTLYMLTLYPLFFFASLFSYVKRYPSSSLPFLSYKPTSFALFSLPTLIPRFLLCFPVTGSICRRDVGHYRNNNNKKDNKLRINGYK